MRTPPEQTSLSRIEQWAETLHQRHKILVDLTLTQNRSSMIRLTPKSRHEVSLRLHRAFGDAPETVLEDLEAVIAKQDKQAWTRVSRFARAIPDAPHPSPSKPQSLHAQGEHFDLAELLTEVKRTYFSEDLDATVTWGRYPRRTRRRRRSIVFASWHEDQRLVRVHPALDQPWVPEVFIRYLLHHELCHAVSPPRFGPTGQRQIHHKDFKALENRFPNLTEMQQLSSSILKQLQNDHP